MNRAFIIVSRADIIIWLFKLECKCGLSI